MSQLAEEVRGILGELSSRPICISDEANFLEAGIIDSFGIIELVEKLESKYSITFSPETFQDRRFPTIWGLTTIIQEIQLAKK